MKCSPKIKYSILICIISMVQVKTVIAAGPKSKIGKLTSQENEQRATSNNWLSVTNSKLKVHSIGIGVGQTFLFDDFEDNGDDSITADLFYNYSASHSFDLAVNAHYSRHEQNTKSTTLFGTAVGMKAKLYQVDSFVPVALAGLGFYMPRTTTSEKKLVFGYHLGGGAELKLNNKFTLGLLLHYHDPFDVKKSPNPKVEGSYCKLLITTLYSF